LYIVHHLSALANMSTASTSNVEHDEQTASKRPRTDDGKDPDTSNEIKWDDEFNDPAAEVILVSSDYVHFRLSSWHIRRKR
jgi:hypothetical protein